jgi:hypothetical protein
MPSLFHFQLLAPASNDLSTCIFIDNYLMPVKTQRQGVIVFILIPGEKSIRPSPLI